MKKLMTAVVVAFVAIATNAATYNWMGKSEWVSANDEDPLEVMAYVFDANAYSLATVTTALDTGDISILANAKGSGVVDGDGAFKFTGSGLTDNEGDPLTASMYTILLDTDDASTASHYYATSVKTVTITDAVIADKASFTWSDIVTGNPSTWADIGGGPLPPEPTPEPTSGLLLLLGLSGLALRRRRA